MREIAGGHRRHEPDDLHQGEEWGTRSWENTLAIQRRHAERQLKDNPSLKSRLEEAATEASEDARRFASSETDMEVGRFRETCPYGWDDMMGREFRRVEGQAS